MPNNQSIQHLIDGVIHPDVSQVIEKYSTFDDDRKYEHILSVLCNQAKNFALSKHLQPYIQLKDENGKFVFNSRMLVENTTKRVKSFDTSLKQHQADIIFDFEQCNSYYTMISYMTEKGPVVDFGRMDLKFNFSELNPLEIIYSLGDPLAESVGYLQQHGEVFPLEFSIDANVLFHYYDKPNNVWTIASPYDSRRIRIK